MQIGTLKTTLPLVAAAAIVGCGQPRVEFERISLGMTKTEVIQLLGAPSSIAAQGGLEIFVYEVRPGGRIAKWPGEEWPTYFVRFIGTKVESFGRKGDFDSTKNSTHDVNIHQRIEATGPQTKGNGLDKDSKFDLESEIRKLDHMKKIGLLNEQEYQQLRKRLIDKAKSQ